MTFRRRRSRTARAADTVGGFLKLGAASKAAKGAGKGARKAAKGTAAYQVAKRTPLVKPLIAGAGIATIAALVAARVLRGGDDEPAPAGA